MPCPRTQHRNNVPILRGEKHDISLKILHQARFKTARQAATSAKHRALTIAPCPSHINPYGAKTAEILTREHRLRRYYINPNGARTAEILTREHRLRRYYINPNGAKTAGILTREHRLRRYHTSTLMVLGPQGYLPESID